MERVEEIGKCQPYMPHDTYAEKLTAGWGAALSLMKHQRKMAFKKVRTLMEDQKCPTELMDAAVRTRDELDMGCCHANIRFCEARFLIQVLQEDPMPSEEELRAKVDADWAKMQAGESKEDSKEDSKEGDAKEEAAE